MPSVVITTVARAAAVTLLLLAASPSPASDIGPETAAAARSVLRHHCWRCHSGEGSEGGDFDVLRIVDLKESGLISAGNPDASQLFQRIADDQMPPRSIPERLTAAEGNAVRRWIAAGPPPTYPGSLVAPAWGNTTLIPALPSPEA